MSAVTFLARGQDFVHVLVDGELRGRWRRIRDKGVAQSAKIRWRLWDTALNPVRHIVAPFEVYGAIHRKGDSLADSFLEATEHALRTGALGTIDEQHARERRRAKAEAQGREAAAEEQRELSRRQNARRGFVEHADAMFAMLDKYANVLMPSEQSQLESWRRDKEACE